MLSWGRKKISINSNKSVWEPDKDGNYKNPAMAMKDLTLLALQRHKQTAKYDDKDCRLDYESQLGVLPQTDAMWGYLWGHAENEIKKAIKASEYESNKITKGHETRRDNVLDKE